MTADPVRLARALVAGAAVIVAGACGGSAEKVNAPPTCSVTRLPLPVPATAAARVPDTSPYDRLFVDAGEEFGVPAPLLRAIGYVETRWQMVEGEVEFAGLPAAHGLMALRGDRLAEGARQARLPESMVQRDAVANVRAAAALLRAYADTLPIRTGDVDAWAPAIARFSGIELAEGRDSYVREVLAVVDGRRSQPAPMAASVSASADCTPPQPPAPPETDQSGAVWRASPNFNLRASGETGTVHVVIIHSCEGSYAGCWSWLATQSSNVSAHYVVREDGAEITQLVRESLRAWHIGAIYDSTLNANHGGILHGVQSNHFTVGVEHAGFARQTSWPVEQIDASARLVCGIAKRWQIPRDRLHIVSHGQLQPYNRTDPGIGWPWDDYLARIERHCTA